MRLRELMERHKDGMMFRQDPNGDIDLEALNGPDGMPPEEYFDPDWLDQEVEILPLENVVYVKVASGESYVMEGYEG